ncbi:hypothetical protein R3P38DRAFT_3251480 [Favolaschia claudopus]|uniref:F-box domain-containing protein n=1 Tax=Favolaschia claudopus TaxID=2862362 RepID=A0AAW0ED75_9AGAR
MFLWERLFSSFLVACGFEAGESSSSGKPNLAVVQSNLIHAPWVPLSFSQLPLDIALLVMGWCGPLELLALRQVCQSFRGLLAKNRYIWHLARANMGLGFPLPTAAPSEDWLASYILNNGLCTVSTSSLQLNVNQPQVRSAAVPPLTCHIPSPSASRFVQRNPGVFLVGPPDGMDHEECQISLLLLATPRLEWTTDSPLFRPTCIHGALEELEAARKSDASLESLEMEWGRRARAMPLFMEMAETVQAGTPSYRKRKREVENHNRSLLAALAKENGVTLDQFITSPTLVRQVNAFAVSLTCLTRLAWDTVRIQCLNEIKWLRVPNAKTHCPFCRKRKYAWDGLQEHIRVAHPACHTTIALPDLYNCTLCPHKTQFNDLKHLRQHVDDKHLTTRADLETS